jgi:hypothetical protein
MICVDPASMYEKAAIMPVSYLNDCKLVAKIRTTDGFWCFLESDYAQIRRKYRGFTPSVSEAHMEGEIISGCCDRADQY